MNFSLVLSISVGTKFAPNYIVKGQGISRGEPALVYLIPNKKDGKDYQKRIRQSEWESAYKYLIGHGSFSLEAFRKTMPDAAKDGECNFHFICGVFGWLGLSCFGNKPGSGRRKIAARVNAT